MVLDLIFYVFMYSHGLYYAKPQSHQEAPARVGSTLFDVITTIKSQDRQASDHSSRSSRESWKHVGTHVMPADRQPPEVRNTGNYDCRYRGLDLDSEDENSVLEANVNELNKPTIDQFKELKKL